MNHKNNSQKQAPLILLSLLISSLLGILGFLLVNHRQKKKPNQILKNIQNNIRKDGPIEGSWIEETKVPWSEDDYQSEVYYGGISRFEGEKIKHYEFIVDAVSGEIIDIYQI